MDIDWEKRARELMSNHTGDDGYSLTDTLYLEMEAAGVPNADIVAESLLYSLIEYGYC